MAPEFRIFLLVGGLGTRLAHLTKDAPKAMASVAGKPFLEWQLEGFRNQGCRDFVLLVGHKKEVIMNYFGDGSRWGVRIQYSAEETPLGTGGAFVQGLRRFPCDFFLLVNGDTYFSIPVKAFLEKAREEPGTVWIGAKLMQHPERYGILEFRSPGLILGFHEKSKTVGEGFINGGIYAGSARAFSDDTEQAFSMENEGFPRLLKKGVLRFVAFGEPFIDIGIPHDFELAQTLIPQWHFAKPRRALFLDRDGILIDDIGYVSKPEEVRLLSESFPLLKQAQSLGFLLIVVTNQAGVAKGKMTLDDVEAVNKKIKDEFQSQGIRLDDFAFCPHHPQGTVPEFSKTSLDRKPEPGLVLKAAEKWGIDLSRSLMIGDKDSDRLVNTVLRTWTIQGRYPLNKASAITTYSQLSDLLKQEGQGTIL